MKTNKFFACVLMVFMCTAFACPVWASLEGDAAGNTSSGDDSSSSSSPSWKQCCGKGTARITAGKSCCNGSYNADDKVVTKDCCETYGGRFVPAQNGKKARCCECASTSGSN